MLPTHKCYWNLIPYRVLVTFIMLDPVTNLPIVGFEAVKVLGDTETLTAFETAGIEASPFTAAGNYHTLELCNGLYK